MRIKKFTGKTFQDAFENVKKELGEDAVILNSRKAKQESAIDVINRGDIYEITAAVDKLNSPPESISTIKRIKKPYENGSTQKKSLDRQGQISSRIQSLIANTVDHKLLEQTQDIKQIHLDMKEMKRSLIQVSDFLKYSRMPALPDNLNAILKKLVNNDVHQDLAKAIVQTVYSQTKPNDYKNKTVLANVLFTLLLKMIKDSKPLEKIDRQPYVVALIGPTGVGKTTTIAKIAANLKLHNHKKVAIISADTYRIAAIEQLQTFANIANIPMDVVYSPEDMRKAIYKFRDRDFIFIDTVGRSQRNEQHIKELNIFVETANPDEVHLVLSLTNGLDNQLDIIRRFNIMKPNRLLFTKLDEALSTGNIINVLYKHQIPVSYLTNGQVVPNDITVADRKQLANLIYKGVLN
jgi:flagellar biosynthesis protein FlhF